MDMKTGLFVAVAKVGEVENGKTKSFTVNGQQVILANVEGRYYAADNHCPHLGAINLHEGKLEGTILTCPRHVAKFDLVDGRVIRWPDWTSVKAASSKLFTPARPLATRSVRVDGDTISVETRTV